MLKASLEFSSIVNPQRNKVSLIPHSVSLAAYSVPVVVSGSSTSTIMSSCMTQYITVTMIAITWILVTVQERIQTAMLLCYWATKLLNICCNMYSFLFNLYSCPSRIYGQHMYCLNQHIIFLQTLLNSEWSLSLQYLLWQLFFLTKSVSTLFVCSNIEQVNSCFWREEMEILPSLNSSLILKIIQRHKP